MNSSRGGNFRLPRDLESCILYFYGSWLTVFTKLLVSILQFILFKLMHTFIILSPLMTLVPSSQCRKKVNYFYLALLKASSLILIQSLKNNFSNVFLVKPIISAKSSHMTGTFFLPPTAKITMCSEDGLGEGGGRGANVTFAS